MKWKIFCGFKKVLFVVGGGLFYCFFYLEYYLDFKSNCYMQMMCDFAF